jgi:hypothetical protein
MLTRCIASLRHAGIRSSLQDNYLRHTRVKGFAWIVLKEMLLSLSFWGRLDLSSPVETMLCGCPQWSHHFSKDLFSLCHFSHKAFHGVTIWK